MTAAPRRNAFDQPIGDALYDWLPPRPPSRMPLVGRHCRLEPLTAAHASALHAAFAEAPDDRDWTYLPDHFEPDPAAYEAIIAARAGSTDPLHWAVTVAGVALGTLALMRIDRGNGVVELGHVNFAPRLQRTTAATDAIFLLAQHAFGGGYRRLEWKCDSLNAPSRRAALRLGFAYEGKFRDAAVVKARNRDTTWYAMTKDDWREAGTALDQWLEPTNFDADGQQMLALATVRAGGA